MINVDVYVPSMDRTYNFNIDEASKISNVLDEIIELICKKEHTVLYGEKENLIMSSRDNEIIFNTDFSLQNYSIKNGDTLILV